MSGTVPDSWTSFKPSRGKHYYPSFTEGAPEAQSVGTLLTTTQLQVQLLGSSPGVSGCTLFFLLATLLSFPPHLRPLQAPKFQILCF